MLADNLAAHALGGFKESVSFALRICRTCMITPLQVQTCTLESSCNLRAPETHENQCYQLTGLLREHNSTNYSINRRSVLEDVPGFSVVSGLPHDIMHDLFEGVAQRELNLLLEHCVQSRYFTIDELNERVLQYDFQDSKPSLIDPHNPQHKLRQSASQMITLLREFPLLIGDRVPVDDEAWQSFLLLLKICNIALSPVVSHDTIPYLRILIEEKIELFKHLYPSSQIIPKMYYMVHYPSQLEMYGPLVHTWTMRHEAKLSFIKKSSRRGNFKNIPLTVAKRHQFGLSYQFQFEKHLIIIIIIIIANIPIKVQHR